MSYILDALRKADAERDRGAVPGLHAQPFPPALADAAHRGVPWRWIGAGALLGVLVPVVWLTLGRDDAPPAAATAVAPMPPAPVIAAPAPPAAATPPAPAEAPAAAAPQAAPPAVAVAPPRPAAAASKPAAATPPSHKAPVAAVQRPTRAPGAAASDTPNAAPDPRLYKPAELPEAVRRQLPTLQLGGAMHSENAAHRMLIVNGQLLHEGDAAAPGVVLERIRLKSAVFAFQGYRYELAY